MIIVYGRNRRRLLNRTKHKWPTSNGLIDKRSATDFDQYVSAVGHSIRSIHGALHSTSTQNNHCRRTTCHVNHWSIIGKSINAWINIWAAGGGQKRTYGGLTNLILVLSDSEDSFHTLIIPSLVRFNRIQDIASGQRNCWSFIHLNDDWHCLTTEGEFFIISAITTPCADQDYSRIIKIQLNFASFLTIRFFPSLLSTFSLSCRNEAQQQQQSYQNLMFDKRVVRGSNFTPNNLATNAAVRT